jgi:hypothetical protein
VDKTTDVKHRAAVMQRLAEFQPGKVVELEGRRLKVVLVDRPTDYRDYALVEFVPLKPAVPSRAMARLDEKGLHFRVPEGWQK